MRLGTLQITDAAAGVATFYPRREAPDAAGIRQIQSDLGIYDAGAVSWIADQPDTPPARPLAVGSVGELGGHSARGVDVPKGRAARLQEFVRRAFKKPVSKFAYSHNTDDVVTLSAWDIFRLLAGCMIRGSDDDQPGHGFVVRTTWGTRPAPIRSMSEYDDDEDYDYEDYYGVNDAWP